MKLSLTIKVHSRTHEKKIFEIGDEQTFTYQSGDFEAVVSSMGRDTSETTAEKLDDLISRMKKPYSSFGSADLAMLEELRGML